MRNKNEVFQFLIELRSRLILSLIVLFFFFSFCIYFSKDLYSWLASPLLKFLPEGHLIATQIVSPIFVPFKLAFAVSFILAIPFFLYQIWRFISPALYGYERKLIWPFLFTSTFLFYAGMGFAYFIIFPLLFHFLAQVAPTGVILSPDIGAYLDFTLKLLLIFGVLFEIPILMVLLILMQITTREGLIKFRSYAIILAFVLGMLLAPPDVFSQVIVAVPIWLLYELGIFLIRFIK